MDAIAVEAGVTRATVYNHFAARAGLVDAVLSDAVRRHGMDQLVERSRGRQWRDALTAAITTCAGFWEAERVMLRRLFVSEAVEPDVTKQLQQREAWRTEQFSKILDPYSSANPSIDVVGVVVALTSFATYDQLVAQTGSSQVAERAMQLAVRGCLDSSLW